MFTVGRVTPHPFGDHILRQTRRRGPSDLGRYAAAAGTVDSGQPLQLGLVPRPRRSNGSAVSFATPHRSIHTLTYLTDMLRGRSRSDASEIRRNFEISESPEIRGRSI